MKAVYSVLKKPFFGRFRVVWKNPLPQEKRSEWRSMRVKSRSGGNICVWFGNAYTVVPMATIVMGHPMGKEAKGYFIKNGHTELLRNNGYHVVVFDFNGFGESSQGDFGYEEDILAVAREASRQAPGIPLGYHGISLGGLAGVIALASVHNPFMFAIIESAATTLEEFWSHFSAPRISLRVLNVLLPRLQRQVRVIERIKEVKVTRSILFIYSSSDVLTPVEMGQRLLSNCPVPAELWTVADEGHAAIVKSKHRQAYFEKILRFYQSPL